MTGGQRLQAKWRGGRGGGGGGTCDASHSPSGSARCSSAVLPDPITPTTGSRRAGAAIIQLVYFKSLFLLASPRAPLLLARYGQRSAYP